MVQRCCICKHSKRLAIDRDIVKGVSHLKIGKRYGVSNQSVRNHAKNHLSRQLLKSEETRNLLHGRNLLENVQELIQRTKDILNDAESKDRQMISLGAIRELRQTYEFLIKFSVYMREAQQEDKQAERESQIRDIKRLSVSEIQLLLKLTQKMNGSISKDVDVLKDIKEDWLMRARMSPKY